MKKVFCTLLALLLLASSLLSCASETDPKNTPTPIATATVAPTGQETPTPTPEEESWTDYLPQKDFAEEPLVFAFYGSMDNTKHGCSVFVTDDDGSLVDHTLYARNNKITEFFNVTLEYEQVSDTYLSARIISTLASGIGAYDVLVAYQLPDVSLARQGYLTNINDLRSSYIDIDQPYWANDYIKGINYKDKTFWLTGDITLNFIGKMCCTYIHGELYKNLVEKTYGSVYDLVRNKDWTVETMANISSLAYYDVNGNNVIDKNIDQFGYLISWGVEMAYAAGINSSSIDDDGEISIAISSERNVDIMSHLSDLSTATSTTERTTEAEQILAFTNGLAMMYPRCLETAENEMFRNMEKDFYIVPLPLGNDEVEDYRTSTATTTTIVGIPYDSNNKDDAALIMEAMAAENAISVIPTYYDTIIKDRYSRDNDSKEMIDLIHDKVGVDFVNTWTYQLFNSYDFYFTFDVGTLASRIEAIEESWIEKLDKLVSDLDAIY